MKNTSRSLFKAAQKIDLFLVTVLCPMGEQDVDSCLTRNMLGIQSTFSAGEGGGEVELELLVAGPRVLEERVGDGDGAARPPRAARVREAQHVRRTPDEAEVRLNRTGQVGFRRTAN